MNRIFADGQCEFLTDRAVSRVFWVRGAHDFAVFRNRVFTFQNLNNDRLRDHEFAQFAKERTLGVYAVKLLCLGQCQLDTLGCDDAQASFFEFCRSDLSGSALWRLV